MKFKLDECVDARLSIYFEQAGYEASTVHLIEGLKTEKPEGRLWIVELERIRIHEGMEE